jgi:hypothetical protein
MPGFDNKCKNSQNRGRNQDSGNAGRVGDGVVDVVVRLTLPM